MVDNEENDSIKEESTETSSTSSDNSSGCSSLFKTISSLAKKKTVNRIYRFCKRNQLEAGIGALLSVGAILALFNVAFGQILVGLIGGYVLYQPICSWANGLGNFLEEKGGYPAFILIVFILGIAFSAPAIALGLIVSAALRSVIQGNHEDEE
ncbi:MAG: hypothetical protein CMO81_04610 [Waddliaceae bacterium]|nr:hypothetical protein [Waddliaceae bacterium]